MRVPLLLWMLTGCGASTPPAEPVPTVQAVSGADRIEILGDVQHLLAEAVSAQRVGRRGEAERLWREAVGRFDQYLAPTLRAHDARHTLEIEVAIGRFGAAVRGEGGSASTQFKALTVQLADLREVLEASPTPSPEP